MFNQKGVIHLVMPLLLLIIVSGIILISLGVVKNPLANLPIISQLGANVAVKEEYKNPFNKETQYVNPFETYKNPFVVAK